MASNHQSLIPETPILLYPSIAATLGLEAATMLSILTGISRSYRGQTSNGYSWFTLDEGVITHLMPFWKAVDVERVCATLRDQGLIFVASAPFSQSKQLKFALNEKANSLRAINRGASPAPATEPRAGRTLIAPSWQPENETFERLGQLGIPREYARERLHEFVTYWRDSGKTADSWASKFFKHVIHEWREYETQQNIKEKSHAMPRDWRPSEDAMEVLTQHAGISRAFIEDATPEFVLYWRERGERSDNWNKKFRDHVNRQWIRFRSACEHDTTPKRIPEAWQPSNDVYDVLRLANIDIPFAQSLIPEFVIYWRDSNQVHTSWNTRFLQYVKQCWAKRDMGRNVTAKSTREMSIEEQLTDRSWAL